MLKKIAILQCIPGHHCKRLNNFGQYQATTSQTWRLDSQFCWIVDLVVSFQQLVSLCCCPSPAIVEASAEKFKMKKKKTDLFMLCSHHFLHDCCCPLLVTACTNCHFSFASPRNFIARHHRFGICENDFKLSLQKLVISNLLFQWKWWWMYLN